MVQFETDHYGLTGRSGLVEEVRDNGWRQTSGNWITTLEEMSAARTQWRELETYSGGSLKYFQSFDWCYNWCRQFSAPVENSTKPQIRIYTLRKNGRLAMIWPMMRVQDRCNIKKLVFIGEPLTQYGNILADRKLITTQDIVDAWEQIVGTSDVDVVALNNFPAKSVLGNCPSIETSARVQSPTSIMDLSGFADFEALNASLSSSTRRNRNKRRNKFAGLGDVTQIDVAGGLPGYKKLVDQALDWKQLWLTETGRTSEILRLQQTRRFLKSLEEGAVALALTIDGKPAAIEIGFLQDLHYYSYIGAFDWELRDYSPGKVQIEEALRWAIDNGIHSYDLLGNPSTYKTHWSNVEIELASHFKALTVKGKLYESVWKPIVRPLIKETFYRIPVGIRKRVLLPLVGRGQGQGQTLEA